VLTLVLTASASAQQPADVETRAMRDEMQRSMKELRLQGADGPYFIAYKIVDSDRSTAEASFGSLLGSKQAHSRTLSVSVRVGSYELDNSNAPATGNALMALLEAFGAGSAQLPLDDNYEELRRRIWLATDASYKKAVEDLSAKKAKLASTDRAESLPDFSKEPERHESEQLPPVQITLAELEHRVRATSAVFRGLPTAEASEAQVEVINSTERYLNSEGTSFVRQVPEIFFRAVASLRNPTGEVFSDSFTAFGRSAADLPPEDALVQQAQQVSARLTARLKGKVARTYNGPVLVEDQAAADLFATHFANLLSARRGAGSGSAQLNAMLSISTSSLLNKVGTRVLPDFLSVVDNPQLKEADGQRLFGDYKFDEEGVPSRETVLVKDGMLKQLLTSRVPVKGMPVSTGNQRERGVLPGNVLVSAAKSAPEAELKKQLLDLVKARSLDFGIVIRRLNGNQALVASRIYPDGHEELLRDARVAEVNAATFKDILAVSDRRTVFTQRPGAVSLAAFSAGANDDFVSYVVPDLLFEDMTVEHVANETPRLPAEPSPFAPD
jgi:hypothetical protein